MILTPEYVSADTLLQQHGAGHGHTYEKLGVGAGPGGVPLYATAEQQENPLTNSDYATPEQAGQHLCKRFDGSCRVETQALSHGGRDFRCLDQNAHQTCTVRSLCFSKKTILLVARKKKERRRQHLCLCKRKTSVRWWVVGVSLL